MLNSVALSVVVAAIFGSTSLMAEQPDFSKTSAAQADYDFAKNVGLAQSNEVQVGSSRHDFSKTVAATQGYKFSNNPVASALLDVRSSTQHDFSKTAAANKDFK